MKSFVIENHVQFFCLQVLVVVLRNPNCMKLLRRLNLTTEVLFEVFDHFKFFLHVKYFFHFKNHLRTLLLKNLLKMLSYMKAPYFHSGFAFGELTQTYCKVASRPAYFPTWEGFVCDLVYHVAVPANELFRPRVESTEVLTDHRRTKIQTNSFSSRYCLFEVFDLKLLYRW